jgi:flagellar motor switch protein FliM
MKDPNSMQSMTRDKLQSLMERAQQAPVPPAPAKVEEFDWTRPHRFGTESRLKLEGLGRRMAAALQKTLNEHFNQSIEVQLKEFREHCAYRLSQSITEDKQIVYVVGIRDENKQSIGCFLFSFQSACMLIAQMLNDPEAAVGQEGQFSTLEESILMDVAGILLAPMDDVLTEQTKLKIHLSGQPVRGDWVMRTRVLEDLCEQIFSVRIGEKEISFSLILESALLDSYAGVKTPPEISSHLSSVRILDRLRAAPISVCAHVSTEMIALADLTQLEPGDVLVLNKKAASPLQVLLNGRACFHAFPAEQKGKLSLIITEPGSDYE